jgi:SAM-dependent methyltransferase
LEIDEENKEIKEGVLICKNCGEKYPITNYIPRILPKYLPHVTKKTAKSFGYEWKFFSKFYKEYKKQFLDWIYPIKPQFFKDKMILDAGCGTGRHIFYSVKFGAKEVIGVDISDAIDTAYENTKNIPNVGLIQSDIYHLPLKSKFDFIYCIGVLHHLPNPERGFNRLLEHLKDGGTIFVWVYGREGNNLLKMLKLVRRVTIKCPLWLLNQLSFFITFFSYPIIKLIYNQPNNMRSSRLFNKILPRNEFFKYLSGFSFSHVRSIIFDQLLAPIANYYTKEEFESWFRDAKLKNILITWRNMNSWRGMANK